MPYTAAYAADPADFARRYSILVVEPPDIKTGLGIHTGQNNVLAPILCEFSIGPFVGSLTERTCQIHNNGAPTTAEDCYFLPWEADAATTMTIGANADHFFTSTLSGCTVQVNGPANAPTITHGNRKTTFTTHGLATAQAEIDNLLPAPGGQPSSAVRAADYRALCTKANLKAAKKSFPVPDGYHVSSFKAKEESGGRVEGGAFVFGKRDATGDWTFWYQAVVGISGAMKKGYFGDTKKQHISNEVVLGHAVQLFP